MPTTALFIIDIQAHLALSPTTSIPHAPRILHAASTLLHKTRTTIASAVAAGSTPDVCIVFVQHEEIAEKGPLVRGSAAWELAFRPREGEETERLVGKNVRKCADLLFSPTNVLLEN